MNDIYNRIDFHDTTDLTCITPAKQRQVVRSWSSSNLLYRFDGLTGASLGSLERFRLKTDAALTLPWTIDRS